MTGFWRSRGAFLVMMCAAFGPAGCVVIPVNYYPSWSRHNLTDETERSLLPGATTREEVLLLLGEPDYGSEDGLRLGYAWAKVRAIIATTGAYAPGIRIDAGQVYLLQVWFDASDRVFQVSTVKAVAPPWMMFPTVMVIMAGNGSGSVTSSPVGIACSPACSAAYVSGTAVTLTPTPGLGSTFAGWSGACEGLAPCTLTPNMSTHQDMVRWSRPVSVTATFNRQ